MPSYNNSSCGIDTAKVHQRQQERRTPYVFPLATVANKQNESEESEDELSFLQTSNEFYTSVFSDIDAAKARQRQQERRTPFIFTLAKLVKRHNGPKNSENNLPSLQTSDEMYPPQKQTSPLHTIETTDFNVVNNGKKSQESVSMPPFFEHFTFHKNYQHLSILPRTQNKISNATDTIFSGRHDHDEHAENRLFRRFSWETDKGNHFENMKTKGMDADSSDENSTASSMQEGISDSDSDSEENFVEVSVSDTDNPTTITNAGSSKASTYPMMAENKVVLNVGAIGDSNGSISSHKMSREKNNETIKLKDRVLACMKNTYKSCNHDAENKNHIPSTQNSDDCNQQKSIISYAPYHKSLKADRKAGYLRLTESLFVKVFVATALFVLACTFNVDTEPSSVLIQRSAESSTLTGDWSNLADVASPRNPSTDIPLFWHVPYAAGVMVQSVLGQCFDLVQASHFYTKGYHVNQEFRIQQMSNIKFINVNTDSPSDISRAIDQDLVGSTLVDVVIAPRLQLISTIFTSKHQGRLFTLLPDPVERVINTYHGMVEHNDKVSQMTLEEYANSSLVENNWLTRTLVDESGPLTPGHVEKAKEILRKKCIVGLVKQPNESMGRFFKYFEWNAKNANYHDCKNNIIDEDQKSRKEYLAVERGSELWRSLLSHNLFDMEVYRYAQDLFNMQETNLFNKIE